MREGSEPNIQYLFPSEDGNAASRERFLGWISDLVTGMDELKNPNGVNLKGKKERGPSFYSDLIENSYIPQSGQSMENVNRQLLELLQDHPYHSKYFLTNILPMASTPGILGMLTAMLVNGNNLWDVYGPAGAEAEVKVIAMMSKLVGYDEDRSGGYTTWGGQGAVFSGLRLAISKFAPYATLQGVPGHLYSFCSEAAHYSLFKSMEATGLGSDRLIKIRCKPDSSMDLLDLRMKMEEVVRRGGTPAYIVATTGTTDAMGIDDVNGIRNIAEEVANSHRIRRAHIHADSAFGGFFAFFNSYDFIVNPLGFTSEVIGALKPIRERMRSLQLADSLCFDFQKLGQTPYLTSLFLVRDAADLTLVDLDVSETPYVGHRGYGNYHTGYTLECSRMASSIGIYSALLAFGVEGYQRLLAQFVAVNLKFRERLAVEVPELKIVNPDNPGIVTLMRIYPQGAPSFADELSGSCTQKEVDRANRLNEVLFERLGANRDRIFLGDTKKHLIVSTKDGVRVPLFASKLFVISPYTQEEHVDEIVSYLKQQVAAIKVSPIYLTHREESILES